MPFSRPPAPSADLFATAAPAFSPGEVEAIARVRFGLAGTVRELAAERDQNFDLHLADGRAFVLKIANEAEDPAVVDLQIAGLRHIAGTDPDCPVPRVVPTLDGAATFTLWGPDGASHIVRVLTYLEGVPLAAVPRTSAQRRGAGAMLARVQRALGGFHHPAARHHLIWDIAHAGELLPRVDAIAADDLRAIVTGVLTRFASVIRPALDALPHQVVHNDLNPSNILVAPEDPDRITGVFDFGDMVETARINDIAVAAAYQVPADGDPLAGIVPFLAGVAGGLTLTEAECGLLPDLIATRMAMTLTVANERAQRHPHNRDYLLRNTAVAESGLRRLAARDPAEVVQRLRSACAPEPRP